MGIAKEFILSFPAAINELLEARIKASPYYSSSTYDEHLNESIKLRRVISASIGPEKDEELWDTFYQLEDIHGQQLGEVADSCYRQGFVDAVRLLHELEKLGKGLASELFTQ